jgi:splicing factor 3B subunit 5
MHSRILFFAFQYGSISNSFSFSDWITNQHRDTLASHVGHYDQLSYYSVAQNESIARVRLQMLEKIYQPCGPWVIRILDPVGSYHILVYFSILFAHYWFLSFFHIAWTDHRQRRTMLESTDAVGCNHFAKVFVRNVFVNPRSNHSQLGCNSSSRNNCRILLAQIYYLSISNAQCLIPSMNFSKKKLENCSVYRRYHMIKSWTVPYCMSDSIVTWEIGRTFMFV